MLSDASPARFDRKATRLGGSGELSPKGTLEFYGPAMQTGVMASATRCYGRSYSS